jgi:hypothetical protein
LNKGGGEEVEPEVDSTLLEAGLPAPLSTSLAASRPKVFFCSRGELLLLLHIKTDTFSNRI